MNTVLTALRDRIKASATVNYLTDVAIVPAIEPSACPVEMINPAVILTDGRIARDRNLQQGKREVLSIQGAVIVDGYNPRGEYGVIIGDAIRGIKGTAQIINDLATVFDGDVTSLDNCTDCFMVSAGPSAPIFFGSEDDADETFWQMCPFEVQIKRRTTTPF